MVGRWIESELQTAQRTPWGLLTIQMVRGVGTLPSIKPTTNRTTVAGATNSSCARSAAQKLSERIPHDCRISFIVEIRQTKYTRQAVKAVALKMRETFRSNVISRMTCAAPMVAPSLGFVVQ